MDQSRCPGLVEDATYSESPRIWAQSPRSTGDLGKINNWPYFFHSTPSLQMNRGSFQAQTLKEAEERCGVEEEYI